MGSKTKNVIVCEQCGDEIEDRNVYYHIPATNTDYCDDCMAGFGETANYE
jgi:ribosome-binding protein aMBF1 (putative translation factor)